MKAELLAPLAAADIEPDIGRPATPRAANGPSITFIPFHPAHLDSIELQPAQAWLRGFAVDPEAFAAAAVPGLSWSGVIDGTVVGAAGVLPQWPGRAQVWAWLSAIPPRHWTPIVRRMRAVLAEAGMRGFRRVEATVLSDFGPGCRLVRRLGFELEGLMRAYAPDGRDAFLYARVMPWDRN